MAPTQMTNQHAPIAPAPRPSDMEQQTGTAPHSSQRPTSFNGATLSTDTNSSPQMNPIPGDFSQSQNRTTTSPQPQLQPDINKKQYCALRQWIHTDPTWITDSHKKTDTNPHMNRNNTTAPIWTMNGSASDTKGTIGGCPQ